MLAEILSRNADAEYLAINLLSEISPIIPHGCSINHNQKPILIKMLTSIDITININMEIIHKHFIHSFELYRQYRH